MQFENQGTRQLLRPLGFGQRDMATRRLNYLLAPTRELMYKHTSCTRGINKASNHADGCNNLLGYLYIFQL